MLFKNLTNVAFNVHSKGHNSPKCRLLVKGLSCLELNLQRLIHTTALNEILGDNCLTAKSHFSNHLLRSACSNNAVDELT